MAGRRWRGVAAVALVAAVAVAAPVGGLPLAGTAAAGDVRWQPHYTRSGQVPGPPLPVAEVQADGRTAHRTRFVPFAGVGGVVVHHPAALVERIGLHQANHEGARDLAMTPSAAAPVVLPSRGRLSGRQSAADVVVPPDLAVRAPVTGTVIRAGTYVLYCDHLDDFAVIAPDAAPQWEVKVLHIDGVQVGVGDRVIAGETLLAPRATVLPFRSQVDATTAAPSWPHVHVEVVDPAIPDVPNPGSGSTC